MMKKSIVLSIATIILFSVASFAQVPERFVSSKTHIKFFSTTPAEDIEANNYNSMSTLTPATGDVIFSLPMQSFEFEKALMQRHFNQARFLDTKQFPTARLKAKITNLNEIDFANDGTYNAIIEGELTIKGVTNPIKEKGTITVNGNGITAASVFNITLADYGVAFEKGKPSTNIAETVEITVHAEYKPE